MRFKHFLHLVKKHNKNGFPLRLTVDFDSDVYRRSLPVLDFDYFYDEDLDYVL